MCIPNQNELLTSIAGLIGDYRQGEIAAPTPAHVLLWVNQFDEAVRPALLSEVFHVLQTTYFSRQKVREFLGAVAQNNGLVGDNPAEFWRNTGILDIQLRGQSQREMVRTFDEVLQAELGVAVQDCTPLANRFVYLDDAVFSGGHVINDIKAWLPQAPAQSSVKVVTMALHSSSVLYVRSKVAEAAAALHKSVDIQFWRHIEIQNRRDMRNVSEVLWPCRLPEDPLIVAYRDMLTSEGYPPLLRTGGAMGNSRIFSSEESRDLIEQEFLRAGVRIRDNSPNLNQHQHPLGNTLLRTLGFGSLAVTFRNCPNNSPLALWASDPWYPLFPRKTN